MVEPSQRPLPQPINNEYLPEPADENFSREEISIDSADLLIMESDPIQVALVLQGTLSTACNHLRVVASPPDEENRIQVEAYSVINPAETCLAAIEPFDINIGLGSFPSGHYSVFVNDELAGEFDA